MPVPLAVNHGGNIGDRPPIPAAFRRAVLHLLHHHRHPVGYLPQMGKELFPNQLGTDNPLRLVGEGVVREEMNPLLGALQQDGKKLLHPLPGEGADRDNMGKIVGRPQGRQLGEQRLLLLHRVHLVYHSHGGQTQLPEVFHQLHICLGKLRPRLGDQHRQVHIRHRILHLLHHVPAQGILGLQKAGGINKHQLGLPFGEDAGDSGAGGLGLLGDDGYLLPHQAVQEAAFAGVGLAHQGDKSGTGAAHIHPPLSWVSGAWCRTHPWSVPAAPALPLPFPASGQRQGPPPRGRTLEGEAWNGR